MPESQELLSELRTTLGKMEVALRAISDALAWTDEHGTIQWCNAAFDHLVGQSHIQVLGSQYAELLPLSRDGRVVDPGAHPLDVVLETGSVAHGIYECQYAGRRSIMEISATRVQFGDGQISIVILHRDVTASKRMEATIREKMAEFETINRSMMNREGRVLELKREVNGLLGELHRPPHYHV